MSAVASLIGALVNGGMAPADAASMVARAGAEMAVGQPTKATLRTRKWRAGKASQNVTERHAVTPKTEIEQPSQTVTNRHKPSPGDGAHISTSSSSTSKESINKKEKREAPNRERPSRLPPDWQLSQADIDYAISKGVPANRIPVVAEKFKNHWLAASGRNSTALNWHLKWCTWVMNEIDWNRQGAKNGQDKSAVAAADRLLEKVRAFERDDKPDLLSDVRDGAGTPPIRLLSSR
jgi:hypothetical protein